MRAVLSLLLGALAGCAGGGAEPGSPTPAPAPSPRDTVVIVPPARQDSARSRPEAAESPPAADPLALEAAAVVDRQHAAYNRHDLEGFLAAYADSVVIQTLGDSVAMTGKARLRESSADWFAEAPAARVEVTERMRLGPFVVDRQRVSGGPEGKPLEAIGIYEVREGLIRRVWTIPPPPTPH